MQKTQDEILLQYQAKVVYSCTNACLGGLWLIGNLLQEQENATARVIKAAEERSKQTKELAQFHLNQLVIAAP